MTDYSIFFIIAVVATGVGALLFLLSLFGLGEHDLDFDADSGGADVGLLSIKSGIGFFQSFLKFLFGPAAESLCFQFSSYALRSSQLVNQFRCRIRRHLRINRIIHRQNRRKSTGS